MPVAHKPAAIGVSLVAVIAVVQIALQGHDNDLPLRITELTLVESREVDRHLVEDTYSARLRHIGSPASTDFARVNARLAHPFGLPVPGLVEIVDGDFSFGTVRLGETVDSVDTVTIRQHRQQPLKADQLRWTISARPDLVPSAAWAGLWRFTLTRKDPETGHVLAVADVIESIGPGEPVGFSLLPGFAHCQWSGSDDVLEAGCTARARFPGCLVEGSAQFTLDRSGDIIGGGGTVRVEAAGDCTPTTSGAESIEMIGHRESDRAEPEPFAFGLLTSFVTDPSFAVLIGEGLREAALGEPASERECGRGGWHRFRKPGFRDERECRSFSHNRGGQPNEERLR